MAAAVARSKRVRRHFENRAGSRSEPAPPGPLVDLDRLEARLIAAARARQTVTYGALLHELGLPVGPRMVAILCRALGRLDRARAARGEPELACLVVRRADGLPGEGWLEPRTPLGWNAPGARDRLAAAQARAMAWAVTR